MKILISLIYAILNLLNTHSEEKLIKSFELSGISVANENGWTNATHIHLTKPFEIYKLKLENGLTLECADEHIVFTEGYKEKWVKDLTLNDYVITEYGLSKVVSVERTGQFINMCDMTVDNDRHSYYTNGILSHNTTTSAVFMLHYILFNTDKNALVLGNKRKTAGEILDKAKKIYLELPYFLKPGIYKWNEGEIVLDNGCRLMAEATTINSGISFTFHCVLSDEFAHIPPNIMDKFYNNLFPTITAGKARFMITSTQNGYNLFYRLYKAAEAGINEYAPFKTDWYEVPEWNPDKCCWEKRDEAWHQKQVANYGSEEAFNKQFGTNFDVSANTLISMKTIQKRNTRLVEFVNKEMPGVVHSECWKWHPDFDPIYCKNTHIIMTTDLAEGLGGDSTVCMVWRFLDALTGKMECVGYFKSNIIPREDATHSIQTFMCLMCHPDKTLLSYERNTYGDLFLKQMQENYDKQVYGCANFDISLLVKYYNDNFTHFNYGIKVTSGNKSKHCLLFKEQYEHDTIVNDAAEFMVELNNFTDKGNSTFSAAFGHDDLVMAAVQLTFVKETLQYKLLKDDFEESVGFVADNVYNPFESIVDTMNYNYGYGGFNENDPYNFNGEFNNQNDAYKRLGMM